MKLISKENFGGAIHTALRKATDSKPTSLAYILVHMLDDKDWKIFCEIFYDIISQENPKDIKEMVHAAKYNFLGCLDHAEDSLYKEYPSFNEIALGRRRVLTCLRIAFEMFDDSDWQGMFAYCDQE